MQNTFLFRESFEMCLWTRCPSEWKVKNDARKFPSGIRYIGYQATENLRTIDPSFANKLRSVVKKRTSIFTITRIILVPTKMQDVVLNLKGHHIFDD